LCIINRLVFITEAESVYCAVRTDSCVKQIRFDLQGLNYMCLKIQLVTLERVNVTVFVDKKIYVSILTDKFETFLYVDWLQSLSCEWKIQQL
jgi:hypothetical protein